MHELGTKDSDTWSIPWWTLLAASFQAGECFQNPRSCCIDRSNLLLGYPHPGKAAIWTPGPLLVANVRPDLSDLKQDDRFGPLGFTHDVPIVAGLC